MSLLRILFYAALVAAIFAVLNVLSVGVAALVPPIFNGLATFVGYLKAFEYIFPIGLALQLGLFVIGAWSTAFIAKLLLHAGKFAAAPSTSDAA